jgi:hypothetical protein
MTAEAVRRGRWALGLTVVAVAWGLALIAGALLVPVYDGETTTSAGAVTTSSATLVGENGAGVLAAVGLPVVLALLVWLALHRKCTRASARAGTVAWWLVGLLLAFCLVSAFTIGVFVLPLALALAGAAALTPRGAA